MFENFIHIVLDFVFPPRCLGCSRPASYLCATCVAEIPRADMIDLENSYALFAYHDPRVKKLVWKLKYHGLTAITPLLANLLHELILPDLAEIALFKNQKTLVVPVPLTAKRRRERGFNQAEVLAQHLVWKNSEALVYTPDILQKVKNTPAQASLKDRAARLANLQNAFLVTNPTRVQNQTIIVLDDVITTGATMRETGRTLIASGAKQVFSLALAH